MTDTTGAFDTLSEPIGPLRGPSRPMRPATQEEQRMRRGSRTQAASRELSRSRAEQLARNEELLNIDWNNQTDWLLMTEQTRRLIVSDPAILEGQTLELDPEIILDYALYGTPRSPGVFMGGVSEYFVFDERLGRYVSQTFASDEQMRLYGDTMYTRTGSGQMVTIQERRPGPEVVSDSRVQPTNVQDIEGFPLERDADGYAQFDKIEEWLRKNEKSLTPQQVDAVERFVQDESQFLRDVANWRPAFEPAPPELQVVERTTNILNRRRDFFRSEERRASFEERSRAAAPAFAGREEMDRARAQQERAIARSADIAEKLSPVARWERATFSAVPLGFSEEEMFRVVPDLTPFTEKLTDLQLAIGNAQAAGDGALVAQLTEEQNVVAAQKAQAESEARLGFINALPYNARDRLLLEQSQDWANTPLGSIPEDQRQRMEGRGRALQASAYRSMAVGDITNPSTQLLTEAGAITELRKIAANPARLLQLKQRMAFAGFANEDNYTSDTSLDAATINGWKNLVAEANNNGKLPNAYLAQLMKDPSVIARANQRGGGGGGGFTIRLPAADDIATVIQDVASKRIGYRLPDDQAMQIAQTYVSTVESQLRSQQGASTINEPMTAETFAEQQIGQQFAADERVFQTGQQLDVLTELLGGMQ